MMIFNRLRRFVALILSAVFVVLSPGMECYAALARLESARPTGFAEAGIKPQFIHYGDLPLLTVPSNVPSISNLALGANPSAFVSGIAGADDELKNADAISFLGQAPAKTGNPNGIAAHLEAVLHAAVRKVVASIPELAGVAFGVGDNASRAARDEVAVNIQSAAARTRLVWHAGNPAANIPLAEHHHLDLVRNVILDLRKMHAEPVDLTDVGPITWHYGLDKIAHIFSVDTAGPALRHTSPRDYQVATNGYDAATKTGHVFLHAALLEAKRFPADLLPGIIVAEAFEIEAISRLHDAGIELTPERAQEIIDAGRHVAEIAVPDLTRKVTEALSEFTLTKPLMDRDKALAELRILAPDLDVEKLRALLPQDPAALQTFVNRYASLLVKGFPPQYIDAAAISWAGVVDGLLEQPPSVKRPTQLLLRLKALRERSPEYYRRLFLDDREAVDALLDGRPVALWPSPYAHSEVSGLQSRVESRVRNGKSLDSLGAAWTFRPDSVRAIWSAWSASEEVREIPALHHMPSTASGLGAQIAEERQKTLPENELLESQLRHLRFVANNHPLMKRLTIVMGEMKSEYDSILAERRKQREIKLKLPRSEQGPLKDSIAALTEKLAALKSARAHLKERADYFTAQVASREMALISRDLKFAFANATHLSVAGDHLWFSGAKDLEAALVSPDATLDPRAINPGLLDKLAHGTELSGLLLRRSWLTTKTRDPYRNRHLTRHAYLGVSLWGSSTNGVADQVPPTELAPWIFEQIQETRKNLAAANPSEKNLARARERLQLANSLMLALDVELGVKREDLIGTVRAVQLVDEEYQHITSEVKEDRVADARRAILLQGLEELEKSLAVAKERGQRHSLCEFLEGIFYERHPLEQRGQISILGTPSAHEKPLYSLTSAEALARERSLAGASKTIDDAQTLFSHLLQKTRDAIDRHWEEYPEKIVLNQPFEIARDSNGWPIEATITVGKAPEGSDELVVIAPKGPRQFEVFFDAAIFRMEMGAQRALMRAMLRHFEYIKNGMSLSDARAAVAQELKEKQADPNFTDEQLIKRALQDYDSGVRIDKIAATANTETITREVHIEYAANLAQGFADFAQAPQNGLSGKVLIAWTKHDDAEETADAKAAAERMAEILAGNGITVQLARQPMTSAWMEHCLSQGPYMAGFMVTRGQVRVLGHERGYQSISAMDQILAMTGSGAHTIVRSMKLGRARLKGLVQDIEWWDAYQESLRKRFHLQRIEKSNVRLRLSTPLAEEMDFFAQLGVLDTAAQPDPKSPRLRATLLENGALQIFDLDGTLVAPTDLTAVFASYILERGDYDGPIYRTFGQTRLLDRIAQKYGREIVEIEQSSVKGDADSLVLSPLTAWNDPRSQILLALEIVAEKGVGLGALAANLRKELDGGLRSARERWSLPEPVIDRFWREGENANHAQAVAEKLGILAQDVTIHRTAQAIKIDAGKIGWIYVKREAEGLSIYAESANGGDPAALISSERAYLKQASKLWKPSAASYVSFFASLGLVAGLFITPFFGAAALVEAGSRLINFWRPQAFNVISVLVPPVAAFVGWSVTFLILEFGVYWFVFRKPLWDAFYNWNKKLNPLAREMESIPSSRITSNDLANFYLFIVAQRDLSFGIVLSAARRLWRLLQPMYVRYQMIDLIMNKQYDDKAAWLRNPFNLKLQIFLKANFLQPRVLLKLPWDLFKALFIPIAGLDLPTHISKPVGIPLPPMMRGRGRFEFSQIVKGSTDSDTPVVQLITGDRYGRAKGLDGVENGTPGARRAKAELLRMMMGKTVLFFIPEVEVDGVKHDELADDGDRFMFYAWVQNEVGLWESVNLKILDDLYRDGLVNTNKGAPDAYIPYYIYYHPEPEPWGEAIRRKIGELTTPNMPPAPVVITEAAATAVRSAPKFVDEDLAKAELSKNGGVIDPSAHLALAAEFAGSKGALKRMGRLDMAAGSQLIVNGRGLSKVGDLTVGRGASLHVETSPGSSAIAAMANGVEIDDGVKVVVRLENGARFDVRSDVRFTSDMTIDVPRGTHAVVKMRGGKAEVHSDHLHPRKLLARILEALREGEALDAVSIDPAARGLDFGEIAKEWRLGRKRSYDKVRLPVAAERIGRISPRNFRRLPHTLNDALSFFVPRYAALRRSVDDRYLWRRDASSASAHPKPRQYLLAGLQTAINIQIQRAEAAWEALWEKHGLALRRAFPDDPEGLDELREQILSPDEAEWVEYETKKLKNIPNATLLRIHELREQSRIPARWRGRFADIFSAVAGRVANLGGILYWGPLLFKNSVSVIAAGPYLWSSQSQHLELLVVRPGARQPRIISAPLLSRIPLPDAAQIQVVEVGQDWLYDRTPEANRLLTRYNAFGVTLWGKDLIGVRPSMDNKIPLENLISLSAEMLEPDRRAGESEIEHKERARLAGDLLWAAFPAIARGPRLEQGETADQRRRRAERNLDHAHNWRMQERMIGLVTRSMEKIAAQPAAGQVGGLLVGDFTGGKSWHAMDRKEAIDWVAARASEGLPVPGAKEKFDAAFAHAYSRRNWWEKFPGDDPKSKVFTVANHYVDIGHGPTGRPIEVRVSVRDILPANQKPNENKFIAFLIAETPARERVVDVDRYDVVLGDIFGLPLEDQDAIISNLAAQLDRLVRGENLNAAREAESTAGVLDQIGRAFAAQTGGIHIDRLAEGGVLPWNISGWEGKYNLKDVRRVTQGIASYLRLKRAKDKKAPNVLLAPAGEGYVDFARQMRNVLAGNAISADILESETAATPEPADVAGVLAARPHDLALWIGPNLIALLGADGKPLSQQDSNRVGFSILGSHWAKILDADTAYARGLITTFSHEAPAVSPEHEAEVLGAQQDTDAAFADEGVQGVAPVSKANEVFLAKTNTFYWAYLWSTLLTLNTWLPIILVFAAPTLLLRYPPFLVISHAVRSMVILRDLIPDNIFFNAWLCMALPRGIVYVIFNRVKYWLSSEGKSDTAAWWQFWSIARFKNIFMASKPSVEKEFKVLPKAVNPTTRGKLWDPLESTKDGRIAVRTRSLAGARPSVRVLVYAYAVAEIKALNEHNVAFLLHMGTRIRVTIYKIARMLYFVLTFPFHDFWVNREIAKFAYKRMRGLEIDLQYRTRGSEPERRLVVPDAAKQIFLAPQKVRIQFVIDDSTVRLEDGRTVRVVNAGKPGRGLARLRGPGNKRVLEGRSAWLLTYAVPESALQRLSGHLYLADGPYEEFPISAVHRAAADLHWLQNGHGDPFSHNSVDTGILPLVLKTRIVDPSEIAPQWQNYRGMRVAAYIFVGALAGAGAWLAAMTATTAMLAPIAYWICAGALTALSLLTAHGAASLWKGGGQWSVFRKPFKFAAVSLAALIFTLRLLAPGAGWASAPYAQSVADNTLSVLQFARILPGANLPRENDAAWSYGARAIKKAVDGTEPASTEAADFNSLAEHVSMAPLDAMTIADSALKARYAERAKAWLNDPTSDRSFAANAALLGLYSRQQMLTADQQEKLLQSMLDASDPSLSAIWARGELADALRLSLVQKKIPAPKDSWALAPWTEVLYWASAGKAGWISDSLYFPADSQVTLMKNFMAKFKIDDGDVEKFATGLVYAHTLLAMPPDVRQGLPEDFASRGLGALFAPIDAAVYHASYTHGDREAMTMLLWQSYEYGDSPFAMFDDARKLVAYSHDLALEALKDPKLDGVVLKHLANQVEFQGDSLLASTIRQRIGTQNAGAAAAIMSPIERYRLGRSLFDDPAVKSLPSAKKIASVIGTKALRGNDSAQLQAEVDDYLRPARADDSSMISAARERRDEILVELAVAMEKDAISPRVTWLLLPEAAEFYRIPSPSKYFDSDAPVEQLSDELKNRITPGRLTDWVSEREEDWAAGEPFGAGFRVRSLAEIDSRPADFSASHGRFTPASAAHGDISFPKEYDLALRTYKHGTFRIVSSDGRQSAENIYGRMRVGDIRRIVETGGARHVVESARITSIREVKIKDLTDAELESENPPSFWAWLIYDKATVRFHQINALIANEKRFYGAGVNEDSVGYMIVFEPVEKTKK